MMRMAAVILVFSMGITLFTAVPGKVTAQSDQGLEAVLEPVIEKQMRSAEIAGLAVQVMKDQQTVFAKGWGVADRQTKRPVSTESTLFHGGSLSKVFTATAVMQLLEQNKIRLEDPIVRYVKEVKGKVDPGVTIHHLLTHTGGLAHNNVNTAARDERTLMTLSDYLQKGTDLYALKPPGETIIYSSDGMALLGRMVETVTGKSFAEYVQSNILDVLEMKQTSFLQPPPKPIRSRIATRYHGSKPYTDDYLTNMPPAGDILITAADAIKFAATHLNRENPVLQPETLALMHERHVSHHPLMRGRAYGFNEMVIGGQRMLYHDGASPGTIVRLVLAPERKLAFFIAYNSNSPHLMEKLTELILEHYSIGGEGGASSAGDVSPQQAGKYAGAYRPYMFSTDSFQKIYGLMSQLDVKTDGKGNIVLPKGTYTAVGEGLFYNADELKENLVYFKNNEMYLGTNSFRKLSPYETITVQGIILIGYLLITLMQLLGLAFPAIRRQVKHKSLIWLCAGAQLMGVSALVGLLATLVFIDPLEFVYGVPGYFRVWVYLIILGMLLSICLLYGIMKSKPSSWGALYCVLVVIVQVGCGFWLNSWHLFSGTLI